MAERDIVQFVKMKQFVSDGGHWDKEQLARAVLAEIPAQLCSFMKRKSFSLAEHFNCIFNPFQIRTL